MIEVKGMITVGEAAKRLNSSTEQVRRNLRDGKLKGQRLGNQWFVDEAALSEPFTKEQPLYSREFVQRVYRLREKIAEENPGYVFDVERMLRQSRKGAKLT